MKQGWIVGAMLVGMLIAPRAFAADITLCPTFGSGRLRASVQSLLERRWQHVVRQKLDISCGSAALATILHYQFGNEISEDELIRAILENVKQEEVRRRGGFSLLDLKKLAISLGYRVEAYKMNLEQLSRLKVPALVPVVIRGFKHFVVYRGMIGDRVVLADPSFGNTILEEYRFARLWQGVSMIFSKDGDVPPSQLAVGLDDVTVAEGPGALRAIAPRAAVYSVVGPNEF